MATALEAAPTDAVPIDPARPGFRPHGLSCAWFRPSRSLRPDPRDEIELNLLETGALTYLIGGRKVGMEAGQLGVFWAAIPLQIVEVNSCTKVLAATLPFHSFLRYSLPEAFVRSLLTGAVHIESRPKTRFDCDLFSQWERDLHSPSEVRRSIVMLEMKARLWRMAAGVLEVEALGPPLHPELIEARHSKVEQLACLVARQYTEALNVSDMSKTVGLHPNYAMSLFKKAFGLTIISYLTQHRVAHAQRLLATTNEKIAEVAFKSGFNSISRFNQAFRSACRCSPREYRLQHEVVASPSSGSDRMKRCG